MAKELMTKSEIHDFGIEVVFNYLEKEGHEIVSVNTDPALNPQVVAKKNGQLEFIIVRTACYPSKGQIENNQMALHCIEHAVKHKAICYFASVGIANADGKNDAEMAVPVKGAGYHVAFEGLAVLTRSDHVKVWGGS
jgi:hypothetical protein